MRQGRYLDWGVRKPRVLRGRMQGVKTGSIVLTISTGNVTVLLFVRCYFILECDLGRHRKGEGKELVSMAYYDNFIMCSSSLYAIYIIRKLRWKGKRASRL